MIAHRYRLWILRLLNVPGRALPFVSKPILLRSPISGFFRYCWHSFIYDIFSEGINATEYELFRDFSLAKRVRMLKFLQTLHEAMTGRAPSTYE